MSPIIVLTGPAASGKNTIANLYARKQRKGADIDADLVRWMYRQPHIAPWEGDEGLRQLELRSKHVALLSKAFHEEGCNVIISDVITDSSAQIYKNLLSDIGLKVIRLLPSYGESIRRLHERRHTITDK
jgi:dephospho-CoA kinase